MLAVDHLWGNIVNTRQATRAGSSRVKCLQFETAVRAGSSSDDEARELAEHGKDENRFVANARRQGYINIGCGGYMIL